MKTIYKYKLPLTDLSEISLPASGDVISVGDQQGELVLWVLVEPDEKMMLRTFRIAGTGHPLGFESPNDVSFIGTVQQASGLVWHIFEVIPH